MHNLKLLGLVACLGSRSVEADLSVACFRMFQAGNYPIHVAIQVHHPVSVINMILQLHPLSSQTPTKVRRLMQAGRMCRGD